MYRISRIIFSIIGVALLILSHSLCCHANPVGLSTNCVELGSASCDVLATYGFVFAGADAISPGDPNLPASADASAQADDTLTFFGPGGHAFVEFQFIEIIFAADGGGAGAGATANGQSLLGSPFAITFGVPFSFDMSVNAAEDLSGDVEPGHDEESVGELQLTDILVVNAGGHPLRNIHLTSGSGTLYPLDAANTLPSPEPPSFSLLGFGLIALLFMASRKRLWYLQLRLRPPEKTCFPATGTGLSTQTRARRRSVLTQTPAQRKLLLTVNRGAVGALCKGGRQ